MENKDARPERKPVALSLTVLGALARLLPHPPNFAPVGAVSLFSGARLAGWQAYAVPLVLMIVTDPIVSAFYGVRPYTKSQFFIYASFLISVWIGRLLRNTESAWKIGGACIACSAQFYLVTNFGVWLFDPFYSHTAAGLASCYVAGIPFFGLTMLGDLFYTGVLFGLHAWLTRRVSAGERVASAA